MPLSPVSLTWILAKVQKINQLKNNYSSIYQDIMDSHCRFDNFAFSSSGWGSLFPIYGKSFWSRAIPTSHCLQLRIHLWLLLWFWWQARSSTFISVGSLGIAASVEKANIPTMLSHIGTSIPYNREWNLCYLGTWNISSVRSHHWTRCLHDECRR